MTTTPQDARALAERASWMSDDTIGPDVAKMLTEYAALLERQAQPLMPTRDELLASAVASLKKQQADEAARRAALPAGVCPECDGAGEQGGQFCGGFWQCETCGGSGKTPNARAVERKVRGE